MTRELLTAREAAEALRVHPKTIRQWAHEGKIRSLDLGPQSLRFDPRDIEAFLQARETKVAAA
jgi:excisionase family DNA binding protein